MTTYQDKKPQSQYDPYQRSDFAQLLAYFERFGQSQPWQPVQSRLPHFPQSGELNDQTPSLLTEHAKKHQLETQHLQKILDQTLQALEYLRGTQLSMDSMIYSSGRANCKGCEHCSASNLATAAMSTSQITGLDVSTVPNSICSGRSADILHYMHQIMDLIIHASASRQLQLESDLSWLNSHQPILPSQEKEQQSQPLVTLERPRPEMARVSNESYSSTSSPEKPADLIEEQENKGINQPRRSSSTVLSRSKQYSRGSQALRSLSQHHNLPDFSTEQKEMASETIARPKDKPPFTGQK